MATVTKFQCDRCLREWDRRPRPYLNVQTVDDSSLSIVRTVHEFCSLTCLHEWAGDQLFRAENAGPLRVKP